MSAPPGRGGGTSLAPTPTHPHHLSREPSREEVEMAEQLSQLNRVQEPHTPRTASPPATHSSAMASASVANAMSSPGKVPEIYHSLEDTIRVRASEQPEHAMRSETPSSLPPSSVSGGNVAMIGQVCRCVVHDQYPSFTKFAFPALPTLSLAS